MAHIIDGRKMADEILDEVRARVARLKGKPVLSVVLVGKDPASEVYVRKKEEACARVGIRAENSRLDEATSEKKVMVLVRKLNRNRKVNGILVQVPLPRHIDGKKVTGEVAPEKDVDGFTAVNVGRLTSGNELEGFVPCTPLGVIEMLKRSGVMIGGKNAVVVGRSSAVGKPLALLLIARGATVTVCHSMTKDLAAETRRADILISAVGKPGLITGDMVKQGAVVIDVGITREEDGKLKGDVDFGSVKEKAGMITPVPGGVGPMTIAMLMKNVLKAYEMQGGK
ncbi:Bifunctional protein FolD protein [Candidatus Burarchaeum australiense]|nr:Bifunctional protein FolD protein [Candidatus Burarchaeum australiense]